MTGAEQLIPQIVSSRFAHKAKQDGIVVDVVPNETMTVKYKNGQTEILDILPRKSQTRRGAYISLEMNPLPVGTQFKENQLIASTKNFDNNSSSFMSGKNVSIAVMSYLGYTYEDGYAISSKLAESTTTDTVREISIIVPPETKVFKLEDQIGKKTKTGEELVEFAYEEDLDNYLLANEFDVDTDDEESTIGSKSNSIILKSPGGEIVDIRVYINDRTKTDQSLIKLHSNLVHRLDDIHKKLLKDKVNKYAQLTASDNLDTSFFKIGGHKQKGQEFRGVRVVYLVKTPKPLRVGDKCAPRYGAKGLVAKIYEAGSAYSDFSGDVDCFISPTSVIGRKNLAFIKELYMGKLVSVLHNRVISMLNNPKVSNDTIIKLILDFYKLLSSERTYKSVENRFSKLNNTSLKKLLLDENFHLNLVIEPFHDVSFESIRTVAKMLKVPLDEKVSIKTDSGEIITSDRPVPVGITYLQFLEHFSSQYISVGGAVKYSPITRQPVKIGGGGNVSTIGELDINALIAFDVNDVLEELLTTRSDHHKIKRKVYSSIANSGELYDVTEDDKKMDSVGGTSELKSVYMLALGLITK